MPIGEDDDAPVVRVGAHADGDGQDDGDEVVQENYANFDDNAPNGDNEGPPAPPEAELGVDVDVGFGDGEDAAPVGAGAGPALGPPAPRPKRAKSKWRRPLSTTGVVFTLHMFLHCLIFQSAMFAMLPRLGQEYMLDGYSRWQEITLYTMQQQTAVKFATTRRAAQLATATGDAVGARLPVLMPASVPGSKRYQQVLIDNGMAVIEKYGKPTFWITVTCSPEWEEFNQAVDVKYWRADGVEREGMINRGEISRDRVDLQV